MRTFKKVRTKGEKCASNCDYINGLNCKKYKAPITWFIEPDILELYRCDACLAEFKDENQGEQK